MNSMVERVRKVFKKIREGLQSRPEDVPVDEDGRPIGRRHRHWLQWLAPLYDNNPVNRPDLLWRDQDEQGRTRTD